MKSAPSPTAPGGTRQRLLAGAARVFARTGIAGSTTREIAREAGVNEVTLFRHFQSKDRLIQAVIGENFGTQTNPAAPAPVTGDLRTYLTRHGRRYEKLLTENLPLIRTMIGEVHHHGDHERQVFKAIFRPLRETLVERLTAAQHEGRLRPSMQPEMLADLFGGMIFTGVLRRNSAHAKPDYSASSHLAAAVELIIRGAASEA